MRRKFETKRLIMNANEKLDFFLKKKVKFKIFTSNLKIIFFKQPKTYCQLIKKFREYKNTSGIYLIVIRILTKKTKLE